MINQRPLTQANNDALNILLVGNNPIELTAILETVKKLPKRIVFAEIAFDLASIWKRLIRFKPNYIFIDDNIGLTELGQTVNKLSSNPKTRNIPITILKNSNYSGSLVTNNIMDYLLKQQLTPEALFYSLRNSAKFKLTRELVMQGYNKRSAIKRKN